MTEATAPFALEIVERRTLAPAEEAMIERRAERLSAFYSDVRGCRVTLCPSSPRRGERLKYAAQVELALPAGAISVVEPPAQDRFRVIQDAFDAAARELGNYAVHHRYHPLNSARTSL